MSDRLAVDVDALRQGGVNIDGITRLALTVRDDLFSATSLYHDAGGTGEMGERFNQGYRPGEAAAVNFLNLLGDTLGDAGSRTVKTARNFADADSEASSTSPAE
jgi:hypothetical protein